MPTSSLKSSGNRVIKMENVVNNQYVLYYKRQNFSGTPDRVMAQQERYINDIVEGVLAEGFVVTHRAKHSNALGANYTGQLKPEQVLQLDLSRYNIEKIEPVAVTRMDKTP
jgi:hypothetical protein